MNLLQSIGIVLIGFAIMGLVVFALYLFSWKAFIVLMIILFISLVVAVHNDFGG